MYTFQVLYHLEQTKLFQHFLWLLLFAPDQCRYPDAGHATGDDLKTKTGTHRHGVPALTLDETIETGDVGELRGQKRSQPLLRPVAGHAV